MYTRQALILYKNNIQKAMEVISEKIKYYGVNPL